MKNRKFKTVLMCVLLGLIIGIIPSGHARMVKAATVSTKYGTTVTFKPGDTVSIDLADLYGKEVAYDSYGYTFLKFTAAKTGTLKISATDLFTGEVRLLNANKKAISGDSYLEVWAPIGDNPDCRYVSYAVKAGKTYYIRVQIGTYDGTIISKKFSIKTSFKAVKDQGGKSKAKAKNLKKNKSVTGILPVGEKNARWFKIKLKKNQVLKVCMSFYGCGKSYFLLKPKKGKSLTRVIHDNNAASAPGNYENYEGNGKLKIVKTAGKLKKGTILYIKVYNKQASAGGSYTIRWK